MNIIFVVTGAGLILVLAYFTYGKFLSKYVFRLNNKTKTPAVKYDDGVDFVPAKNHMLLGQHFSAIAAAGPINGPILGGVMFGWVPAMVWVLVGSIFIGGMHDMGSLVASIRHRARSITEVVRENVSFRAWLLFMIFIWITLVYVITAFTDITAGSFVGIVTLESGDTVSGAAIASSSIMYLLLTIAMGLVIKFARIKEGLAIAIFLPLVGLAIWGGQYLPVNLPITDLVIGQKVWGGIVLGYCLIASVLPMWLLLQPRGALGGYFLYAALLAAAIGICFGGYTVQYPAFINLAPDGSFGAGFWSPMFPVLFITIACGACSGFHALVSSGTTCKQLIQESDAKSVGYGAMLLEGMVAIVSLACVMVLAKDNPMVTKAPNFIYASGIGNFLKIIGIPAVYGVTFGLMAFTTFVYDTLDVTTRLGRYVLEELTGWKGVGGKLLAALLTAGTPLIMIFQTMTDAQGKVVPAWRIFWNTFGASNQLLASLVLICITCWLVNSRPGSKVWLASFIPGVFMFVIADWALVLAVIDGWVNGKGHFAVPWISLVLIILSVLVAIETNYVLYKKLNGSESKQSANIDEQKNKIA